MHAVASLKIIKQWCIISRSNVAVNKKKPELSGFSEAKKL
jgi:hypothetical protein